MQWETGGETSLPVKPKVETPKRSFKKDDDYADGLQLARAALKNGSVSDEKIDNIKGCVACLESLIEKDSAHASFFGGLRDGYNVYLGRFASRVSAK